MPPAFKTIPQSAANFVLTFEYLGVNASNNIFWTTNVPQLNTFIIVDSFILTLQAKMGLDFEEPLEWQRNNCLTIVVRTKGH